MRTALREILVCFPVYRTYIREGYVLERDRQVVCRAAAQAKRHNPATDAAVFDFIRDVLLLERPPDLDAAGRRERELFVGRVQQVTSPVMAKGVEDTAFYRYFPLASLNEVGGDPLHGAVSIEEFHRHNLARQSAWPQSLICTATHDTKRSEDARARINVLAEIPHLWRNAVNRWARLNRRHHREADGQPAPSRNDEYLFYQTLIGVWPLAPAESKDLRELAGRMAAYMEKATHEAKVNTSWINPDAEYDAAIREFVAAVLDDHPKNRFLAEFRRFHEQIVNWGLYSALSQTLLKLTSPGVPDLYQGQELWDFSLVDPDNRRPVDFANRRKMLAQLRKNAGRNDRSLPSLARQLALNPRDPRLKLFVTWRVLQFRRQSADLFRLGDYIPLEASGPQARHVCAFARECPRRSRGGKEDCHGDRTPLDRAVDADADRLSDGPASHGTGCLGRHLRHRRKRDLVHAEEPVHGSGVVACRFPSSVGRRARRFSAGGADDRLVSRAVLKVALAPFTLADRSRLAPFSQSAAFATCRPASRWRRRRAAQGYPVPAR